MKKKWYWRLAALMVLLLLLPACKANQSSKSDAGSGKVTTLSAAIKSSKGKTVTFYGFGGDEKANLWVDQVVTPAMKKKYDITVKRVPMDIDDILNKLTTEKEAGNNKGDIDVVWINGENFYTAKQANLLYGPIANKVPSFNQLMAVNGHSSKYDFGVKINGYEVPYGNAQLVFGGDKTKFPEGFPTSSAKLLAYAKLIRARLLIRRHQNLPAVPLSVISFVTWWAMTKSTKPPPPKRVCIKPSNRAWII